MKSTAHSAIGPIFRAAIFALALALPVPAAAQQPNDGAPVSPGL